MNCVDACSCVVRQGPGGGNPGVCGGKPWFGLENSWEGGGIPAISRLHEDPPTGFTTPEEKKSIGKCICISISNYIVN